MTLSHPPPDCLQGLWSKDPPQEQGSTPWLESWSCRRGSSSPCLLAGDRSGRLGTALGAVMPTRVRGTLLARLSRGLLRARLAAEGAAGAASGRRRRSREDPEENGAAVDGVLPTARRSSSRRRHRKEAWPDFPHSSQTMRGQVWPRRYHSPHWTQALTALAVRSHVSEFIPRRTLQSAERCVAVHPWICLLYTSPSPRDS